jgi:hypothetical protein
MWGVTYPESVLSSHRALCGKNNKAIVTRERIRIKI